MSAHRPARRSAALLVETVNDIREAQTDEDILRCWPLFRQLRPHLVEAEFLPRVRRQQAAHGYVLTRLEVDGAVVSAAGWRVMEFLAWGRVFYVDDLITDEASRGRGLGAGVMQRLLGEARRRGCDEFHLDSGHQRFAAHGVYHSAGLRITSHHFSLGLK
ncbi:MAG: GNAT family N-acetyltransferase [Limisphaerales bacterium]